jgi:hypothetical protein
MLSMNTYRTEHCELAWAAGFFDGEGTIGSYTSASQSGLGNPKRYIALKVTQVDKRPLFRFQAAMGIGTIHAHRPAGRGIIHTLEVQGLQNTQVIVAKIWPWLSEPKRLQIVEAFTRYHAWGPQFRLIRQDRAHGTYSCYSGGCRCSLCTEAVRQYHKDYRAKYPERGRSASREYARRQAAIKRARQAEALSGTTVDP